MSFRACLSLVFLVAAHVRAAQVSWNGAAQSADTDSAGRPLTAEWIFELGAFAPGFIPVSTNTGEWASKWTTAGRTAYDPVNRAFTGPRFTFTSNAAPFTTTNRGWIWGYHPARQEWILLGSPSWLWPDASQPGSLPPAWETPSATQTVVGSLGSGGRMQMAAAAGPLPVMPWSAWQVLYFNSTERADTAISGPDADPDGDRISNALEFLTGSAPRSWNALPVEVLPGTGVTLRSAPAAQGTLRGQVSGDLLQWHTGAEVRMLPVAGGWRFEPAPPLAFPLKAFWRFSAELNP